MDKERFESLYNNLHAWMSAHTPGFPRGKSIYKGYQKSLWNPLIEEMQKSGRIKIGEQDFFYTGPIFRLQNYNSRAKLGHINEVPYNQSWSRSIDGVSKLTNLDGKCLLLEGYAKNAIDLTGALCFLVQHMDRERRKSDWRLNEFWRYLEEEEVVYPVLRGNISKVTIVEHISKTEIKKVAQLQEKDWIRTAKR